jgi:hypothetical protein
MAAKVHGLFAASRRIENDADAHAQKISLPAALVEEKANCVCRAFPQNLP